MHKQRLTRLVRKANSLLTPLLKEMDELNMTTLRGASGASIVIVDADEGEVVLEIGPSSQVLVHEGATVETPIALLDFIREYPSLRSALEGIIRTMDQAVQT